MRISIDYINIKIPIIRFSKKSEQKYPIADNVRVGSVVMTRNCLDIGWVASIDRGKPKTIYSRYYKSDDCKDECPKYGGVDEVTWYDTGVWMTFKDWLRLSEQYNAKGFNNYWKEKLKI